MKNIFAILVYIVALSCPLFVSASYFTDNFSRADGSVGNGWSEASAGPGCSQGISTDRYRNTGNNDCGIGILRTDVGQMSGVSITTLFGGPSFDHRFINFAALLANNVSQGDSLRGYGSDCGGLDNTCRIIDNDATLALTPFTFNNTDTFAMQADIYPAPQNWMDVYVWDYTTGSKPATPTLSFHNGGADYTPIANGTAYAWDTRSNFSPPGTDTAYLYMYEVDPFDPTPPSVTDVSITSSNASTTLAKVGDAVTVTFDADEALQTPVVSIAGHAAQVATTTGNSFTASTTVQTGDTEGNVPFSISYSDLAGNAGFVTSTTTGNSVVTIDTTAPTITITSGLADNESTTTTDILFDFSTDVGATLACAFDYATTSPCAGPYATTTAVGGHTFSITATDPAGNTSTTSRGFTNVAPAPAPAPTSPPTGSGSSSGGGQPVGSSPTAPGFQTPTAVIPTAPPTTPQAPAPQTAALSTHSQPHIATVAPALNPPATASNDTPATANPITQTENSDNLAAAAQSGIALPWWILLIIAGIITFITGLFVGRWTAQ